MTNTNTVNAYRQTVALTIKGHFGPDLTDSDATHYHRATMAKMQQLADAGQTVNICTVNTAFRAVLDNSPLPQLRAMFGPSLSAADLLSFFGNVLGEMSDAMGTGVAVDASLVANAVDSATDKHQRAMCAMLNNPEAAELASAHVVAQMQTCPEVVARRATKVPTAEGAGLRRILERHNA